MRFKHVLRHKKTWQLILVGLLFIFVLLAGIAAIWVVSILKDLPAVDFNDLTTSIPQTSYILDAEGETIDEVDPSVFSENIPIDQVPDHMKQAFLAVEDRSFYDHHGMDARQLAASILANAKSGAIERGGSTITQQLVKNVYLSGEQSLDRKIKEAYLTLGMEEKLSKDAILEAYLNRVDLGLGSQGGFKRLLLKTRQGFNRRRRGSTGRHRQISRYLPAGKADSHGRKRRLRRHRHPGHRRSIL